MKELAAPSCGAGGFGRFKPGAEELRTEGTKYLSSLFAEFASRDGLIQTKLENGEFGLGALRNYLLPGMIESGRYCAADVEAFSLLVQELPGAGAHLASPFLGQLVLSARDEDFVIHTSHLPWRMDYFLRHNTKNVVVEGPAGNFACSGMKSGLVRLEGGCGSHLGQYMEGGRIEAAGPLDHSFLGYGLRGGAVYLGGVLAAGK